MSCLGGPQRKAPSLLSPPLLLALLDQAECGALGSRRWLIFIFSGKPLGGES